MNEGKPRDDGVESGESLPIEQIEAGRKLAGEELDTVMENLKEVLDQDAQMPAEPAIVLEVARRLEEGAAPVSIAEGLNQGIASGDIPVIGDRLAPIDIDGVEGIQKRFLK